MFSLQTSDRLVRVILNTVKDRRGPQRTAKHCKGTPKHRKGPQKHRKRTAKDHKGAPKHRKGPQKHRKGPQKNRKGAQVGGLLVATGVSSFTVARSLE